MGFYTIACFECGVKLFVYVSTEIWLIFPNWEERKIYFISLPICFGCKFKSLMLLVVVVVVVVVVMVAVLMKICCCCCCLYCCNSPQTYVWWGRRRWRKRQLFIFPSWKNIVESCTIGIIQSHFYPYRVSFSFCVSIKYSSIATTPFPITLKMTH